MSLLEFHAGCISFFEKDIPVEKIKIPELHRKILASYQKEDRRRLAVAPVGFAKSSTIRSFALYNLLRGEPLQLYATSSIKKAEDQFTSFVSFCEDNSMQKIFDFELRKATAKEIVVKLNKQNKECKLQGVSKDSDISGINFQSSRPGMILIDDIEELEQANSIEQTDKLLQWIKVTLESRLPSVSRGKLRMIGTNLSKNSIVNRIITGKERGGGVDVFTCFDENGNSVWEERHPTKALRKLQEEDPRSFAQNYLNEPLDVADALIKKSDLRYYDFVDLNQFKSLVMHADTTHTGKTKSDYFCLCVMGKGKDNLFYLVDFILERLEPSEQADSITAMFQKYNGLVPNIRLTYDAVSNDVFESFAKERALKQDCSLPLEPVKISTDKYAHFSPHSQHFKANRVMFPAKHPLMQLAEDQLLSFPSPRNSVNDDFVDGLSGCFDGLTEPAFEVYFL